MIVLLYIVVTFAIVLVVGLGLAAIGAAMLSSETSQEIERRKEDL